MDAKVIVVKLIDVTCISSHSILYSLAHLFQLCEMVVTNWNHINIHFGISILNFFKSFILGTKMKAFKVLKNIFTTIWQGYGYGCFGYNKFGSFVKHTFIAEVVLLHLIMDLWSFDDQEI